MLGSNSKASTIFTESLNKVLKDSVRAQWAREQDSVRNLVHEPIVRARNFFETPCLPKVENMFPAGWPSFSAKALKI